MNGNTTKSGGKERIEALDALRGVAVLGILLMNIQAFSMPSAAYQNPPVFADFEGVNKWVWVLSHGLAELKFLAIFSMLFGAGILFIGRSAEDARSQTAIHLRRMAGLLVIGLAHAYLIWDGDILVGYALCGLLIFWLRELAPARLAIIALLSISVPSILLAWGAAQIPHWSPVDFKEVLASWHPNEEALTLELIAFQHGWTAQNVFRWPAAFDAHTSMMFTWTLWRAGGMMLLGMALFKWGVLTGARSDAFYRRLALIGFTLGLPVVAYGVARNLQADFALQYSMYQGVQFNYWASLPVVLGYVSVVMLLCRRARLSWLTAPLAAVGRTALTNYLLQSVICTFIFYGHGLGYFGQLERVQQLGVVLAVWAVQCIASVLWLRYFRQGPLEWVWRCFTYLKVQPIRLRAASA